MQGSLAQVGMIAMGLVGLVSVVRARRARRSARRREDPAADKRQVEAYDMERRMASYLAARDEMKSGGARDDRR